MRIKTGISVTAILFVLAGCSLMSEEERVERADYAQALKDEAQDLMAICLQDGKHTWENRRPVRKPSDFACLTREQLREKIEFAWDNR